MGIPEDWEDHINKRGNFSMDEDFKRTNGEERVKMQTKASEMKAKLNLGREFSVSDKLAGGKFKAEGLLSSKSNQFGNVKSLVSMKSSTNNKLPNVNNYLGVSSKKSSGLPNVKNYLSMSSSKKSSVPSVSKFFGMSTSKKESVNVKQLVSDVSKNKKGLTIQEKTGNDLRIRGFIGGSNKPNISSVKGVDDSAKIRGLISSSGNSVNNTQDKLRGLIGSGRFNPSITMQQYKGLEKQPFGDSDNDKVMNLLDCQPRNRNKQGFFDVFKKKEEEPVLETYSDDIAKPSEVLSDQDAREQLKAWEPGVDDLTVYNDNAESDSDLRYEQGFVDATKFYQDKRFTVNEAKQPVKKGVTEQVLGPSSKGSVMQEVISRAGKAYQSRKAIKDAKREALKKTLKGETMGSTIVTDKQGNAHTVNTYTPYQQQLIKVEEAKLRMAEEREKARIAEEYGGAGGVTEMTFDKRTGKPVYRMRGGARSIGGSPSGPIAKAEEAVRSGFGGRSLGGDKVNYLTGQQPQGTGLGLAMMSGGLSPSNAPTGFSVMGQSSSIPKQKLIGSVNYGQVSSGGIDKATMLMGSRQRRELPAPQPVVEPQEELVTASVPTNVSPGGVMTFNGIRYQKLPNGKWLNLKTGKEVAYPRGQY